MKNKNSRKIPIESLLPVFPIIERKSTLIDYVVVVISIILLAKLFPSLPASLTLSIIIGLGLNGVPGRIYQRFLESEHYNGLLLELPYMVVLLLVSTASGLGIESFFRKISGNTLFSKISIEAKKYLMLTSVGKTSEEALYVLERQSKNSIYSKFLRGLITILSTTGRVPEYASSFLQELSRSIGDKWKSFLSLSTSIIEVSLLLGISIMSLIFMSSLLGKNLLFKALTLFDFMIGFIGLFFYITIIASRPLILEKYHLRVLYSPIITILVSMIVLVYTRINGIIYDGLLVTGPLLIVGGLPILYVRMKSDRLQEKLIETVRELGENIRIGYSYQTALERVKFKETIEKGKGLGLRKNVFDFFSFLYEQLSELGGGIKGFLDTLYFFYRDLVYYEKNFRRNSIFLQLMGVLLPVTLYLFTEKTISMVYGAENFSFVGMDFEKIESMVLTSFLLVSLMVNFLVSLIVDSTVLSTFRHGISFLLFGFVGKFFL